jgi:plasmid stabilization system protein ParE
MKILVLDEAEQDLINGFNFYESQSQGLGEYFLDSLFSDIESLKLFAGIHSWHFGYQRLLAKRFPFAIYYLVDEDTVRVWAILDTRQNPETLRDRLSKSP